MKTGVKSTRRRGNRHKSWATTDEYRFPTEGPLFPGRAEVGTIGYEAVQKLVHRLAPQFVEEHPGNGFEKMRTHSGRASAITAIFGG